MKLTTLLLIIALVQASAKGFAQKISLNETNAPLEKVINTIKQQSGYVFLYTDQELKNEKITVKVSNASIEETLKAAFKNTPIDYKVVGNNILLKKTEPSYIDQAKAFFAQVTVTGKVFDETGQPMMGVTVKIKNTNLATSTDVKGAYSITVPDDKTIIVFTFIGYEPVELAAKDIPAGSTVTLKATAQNLQEVVVNKGYYSVKQELNTGSSTKITSDIIEKQPVGDPIMALEGRVPGLYISQASGIPGANLNVRLRGQNSISNGNSPLYIVDGVPFTSTTLSSTNLPRTALGIVAQNTNANTTNGVSPFSTLNPADIESIEILKDADATAIYGSRGANGVILITTKKGKAGITRVDASIYSGMGQITRKIKLLNTQQYLQMRREAFLNDGLPLPSIVTSPTDRNNDINGNWDITRYTDWQKELIGGTAHFTNAQASVSGGNANTQFLLGGGYSRQTTVFPGDYSDQKASVHFNLNHTSNNQLFRIIFSAQYINDKNVLPNTDFTSNILLAPDAPAIYDDNGNLNWQKGTWINPLSSTLINATAATDNLISSMNLSYEILPGLQIRSSFGFTHMQLNQSITIPATVYYGPPSANNRNLFLATSNVNTWSIEPQITYNKKIGQGKLDVLIGTTWQQNSQNTLGQSSSGFSSDALISNIALASSTSIVGSNYTEDRYNAIFGRIGYSWQEKYLLNLTARRDGSSRFGPANKFGNFGAIGAGWIFSKEKLIADAIPWLSFGKLRTSYGTTGNYQIPDYQYLSSYSPNTSSTYQNVVGLYPTRIANPYFSWEVVKKLEGGIDLGFLRDQIMLSANYYRNRTGNQLVGQALPSIDGFQIIQANLPAVVQNTGIELVLNTVNLKSRNFTWTTSINLSIPRNKLVSYPNLNTSTNKSIYAIGEPLTVQWLYHYTGVNPQTGLYTFQDVDNDGQLGNSDRFFTKPITQNYFGGFQNSFSYKGLQLDVFFQFVKQTGYNYINYFSLAPGIYTSSPNQATYVLDRWSSPGNSALTEKYTQAPADAYVAYNNLLQSDYNTTDASFIRLKNLALSYSLPLQWQRKAKLQNARIYVQCQNLFTITNYKGLDPENQSLRLPPLRMMTLGMQIGL